MMMENIAVRRAGVTRSINAENPRGEKGRGAIATEGDALEAARELGQGWKVAPCITLAPGSTTTLAEITGPGTIQHIWITVEPSSWRQLVLRMYWDDEESPSVEVPLGDFFCNGWNEPTNVNSLPISVNPKGGFNSYWPMPFRRSARITVENLGEEKRPGFFYQIDYQLAGVPEDALYLHAQWRRNNPLKYGEVHTLLDGVRGSGHYVGSYIAWQSNSSGWWGEGEMKFYLDGDEEFPTICGTGTEDYFGGAWGFESTPGQYETFSTPYLGMPQVLSGTDVQHSQRRFGLYRWHVADPICFDEDLRVTIQALGWRSGGRFLLLQDDIASTAFWYQSEPHAPFPPLPDRDGLEVI